MESFETAKDRRTQIIRQLRNQSRFDEAEEIDNCLLRHPCQQALCPVCKLSLRKEFGEKLTSFLRNRARDSNLYAITLIESANAEFNGDIRQAKNTLTQRLRRLFGNRVIAIGCFDLCLNQDSLKEWKPFWHKHFHLIIITNLTKENIKMPLKRFYPTTRQVKRPLRIVKVRTFKRTLTYVLPAPYFPRRVRFLNTKTTQRKPFLAAKEYPLKARELAELSDKIKGNKVRDFLFQYGVRL
ncbi:MAG: hypothetical protein J5787_09430 [Alphaproteobacteria bacterium]|nr:hypothetical protein [Alphaproteobacteria bacterium]